MKALLADPDEGLVYTTTHPLPSRGPGEALIKVTRAGVCNTDLEILKGYMGFNGVLGHEFVGVVEEIDASSHFKKGQRVVGEINLACNNCETCSLGGIAKRNHCRKRTVLGILNKDGTFAEYLTLPVVNLFAVPDSLPDEQAVFTEPLAAAFRIMEQISFLPTHSVALIGDGKLGLMLAEVLSAASFRERRLFGRHEHKMALAPSNVRKTLSTEEAAKEFENHFDFVVEASGSPSGIMMAATLTRPLGTIILKTTCAAESSSFNTAPFVVKELNILGSRCGNFKMALDLLASGNISVGKYIDGVYNLDNGKEAIKHAGTKGALKIQLLI